MKQFRKNNQGITLIELLITLTITSFVALGAFSFVGAGMNGYQTATKEANLQNNQQVTMNFLSESIMEAVPARVELQEMSEGKLKLFTGKHIYYYDGESSLYLYEDGENETERTSISASIPGTNAQQHLISKYITKCEFTVNKDSDNVPRAITVKCTFTVSARSRKVENTYKIRNH